MLNVPPPSRASSLPQGSGRTEILGTPQNPCVGASLLAIAVGLER